MGREDSFEPGLRGRLAVVGFCWFGFVGSFVSPLASRHVANLLLASLWLIAAISASESLGTNPT